MDSLFGTSQQRKMIILKVCVVSLGIKTSPTMMVYFFSLHLIKKLEKVKISLSNTIWFKSGFLIRTIMSDAPPVQGIPLQFIYMCLHYVDGYFRRRDGRPLNISTMEGPNDQEVVCEPLDPEADPQVHLQLRPLSQICPACEQYRVHRIERIRQRHGEDSRMAERMVRRARNMYAVEYMMLLRRSLGIDTLGVQRRLQHRLIQLPPLANNNPQEPQESQELQEPQEP